MSIRRLSEEKSDELTNKFNRDCGLLRRYGENWGDVSKKQNKPKNGMR